MSKDPFDNIVPGTSLSRLAQAFRLGPQTPPGEEPEGEGGTEFSPTEFIESRGGVPNPYGVGLAAYEPNTVLFSNYAEAYGRVQSEKAKAEAEAGEQLVTADFTRAGAPNLANVPFADLFRAAGAKYGVPAQLLAAVARAESNFRTDARSPAGALGLMQFMPATAAGMGVNPMDPASAIDGAARYLQANYNRFGSWDLALAAYNAGPGAVSKYGGIPPFTETQGYVRRVNQYLAEYGSIAPRSGGGGSVASGPSVQAGGKVQSMVSAAMTLAARRVPYVWGGTTANGVDCSGLIYYAAKAAGINIPRVRAVDYGQMGRAVSLAEARPGDIVYYDNPNTSTDHVGIYLGNGQVVQAPQSGDVVKVTSVGRFTSIRRIFEDAAFAAVATPSGGQTVAYNGRAWNPAQTFAPPPVSAVSRLLSKSKPLIVSRPYNPLNFGGR